MKTLEEKKLLVKMARAFNQPVDQSLIESIEREEKLAAALFGKKQEIAPPIPILQEDVLTEIAPEQKPAETNIQPPEEYKVQQVTNYLNTVSKAKKPPLVTALQDNEFEALRKTVHDLLQKVNTLSWGGGGTGAVRINDQDDFDRTSYGEGRYLKWSDGMFRLDEINPFEVVHNTTLVTSNTYVVQDDDYYIGVNVNERSTIILPSVPDAGRMVIIKDESGNAQLYPIKIDGNVDNDPGGAEIRINNGGVQLIYRNGWRIV
jgi:hypothetical protein